MIRQFFKLFGIAAFIVCLFAGLTYIYLILELKRMPNPQEFIRELTPKETVELYIFSKASSYRVYRRMKIIAACESSWRKNAVNPKSHDYGLFQINQFWIETAYAKGYDVINDWRDNVDFAIELQKKEGFKMWDASKPCQDIKKI